MFENNAVVKTLKKGDKVALIAPSSSQKKDEQYLVEKAISLLQSWGLDVVYQPDLSAPYFYLSANDETRLAQIQTALDDNDIKAIFCTRGGYGLARIVDKIKQDNIYTHKWIIGYSDVTALHLALYHHPLITCVHGPVLASKQVIGSDKTCDINLEYLYQMLFHQPKLPLEVDLNKLIALNPISVVENKELFNLDAACTGGNLTMLATSLGTSYEFDAANKILLIEEIGEAPYKVDRLLTQLKNAGKFDNVSAIFFGQMTDCESNLVALDDVLKDLFFDAPYPVFKGLEFGHDMLNYSWIYNNKLAFNL